MVLAALGTAAAKLNFAARFSMLAAQAQTFSCLDRRVLAFFDNRDLNTVLAKPYAALRK